MCCDVCCKEFKGWCRVFTKTERALTILEVVLLVLLIVFLIFLILHFLACSSSAKDAVTTTLPPVSPEIEEYDTENILTITAIEPISKTQQTPTTTNIITTTRRTMDPERECTWTPSAKTTALVRYFEGGATQTNLPSSSLMYDANVTLSTSSTSTIKMTTNTETFKKDYSQGIDFIQADESDGEDAETIQKKHILALVKLRPPQDVVFGCILTIISQYWVLTSASCIEAIEEVDSLDSFVIMEKYGSSSKGKIHSVFDLQIHPFYQGTNKSYDLAALKSESSLVHGQAVKLPTSLDYSLISIGERFQILGFGSYRSIDKSAGGRSLRRVFVYRVPGHACWGGGARGEAWAPRHLVPGRGAPPAPCAPPALCAGALYARGLPCNYCSGTPLLRAGLLLGLQTDNQQCGVACEPQLYVNIAAVRDWIDSLSN